MEFTKIRSVGSRSGCSSSGSAYTLPNSNRDSGIGDEEEQKDYVVFDENFNPDDWKNVPKMLESHQTFTSKMIFEDDNPVKVLIKSVIPLCCEVKHSKF